MAEPARKKTYNTDWKSRKATKAAMAKFQEDFKKSMGVDLAAVNDDYQVVSTGSLNLDYALTIGGMPTGRIVEIWGPEHAGKTTLAMLMVAQYQQAFPDKVVGWIDMEQTFDPKWARALGVDVEALSRMTPRTAEDTADAAKRFVESGYFSLVVLDSVGGMISRKEFEKESDEATVGLIAKIVTRMVKQCSPMAKSNGTTVCVVNQVRAAIDSYGPAEVTAGGWALKHVTSIKLKVRRSGTPHTVTRDGQAVPVGHQMAIKVEKNKMGPYGQTAMVWLHNVETDKYGPIGVDVAQETFDFAKRLNLMGDKGGGYYTFEGVGEVRGEPAAIQVLRDHPEVRDGLRKQILDTLSGKITDESSDDDEPNFSAAMKEG